MSLFQKSIVAVAAAHLVVGAAASAACYLQYRDFIKTLTK